MFIFNYFLDIIDNIFRSLMCAENRESVIFQIDKAIMSGINRSDKEFIRWIITGGKINKEGRRSGLTKNSFAGYRLLIIK